MDIWITLGIKRTKEKKIIRQAYLEKLKQVTIYDNPDELEKLRLAYEQAMTEENVEKYVPTEHSQIEVWYRKIAIIYSDFEKRIDEKEWNKILNDILNFNLEEKIQACDKLLQFLSKKFFLPKPIWELIDRALNIKNRRDELYRKYPKDFINYIINSIDNMNSINYYDFKIEKGKNYDEFIKLYYKIIILIHNKNYNEIYEKLKQLKQLNIYHPALENLEAKYLEEINRLNNEKTIPDKLYEQQEDSVEILYKTAENEIKAKSYEKAIICYEKILEVDINNYKAKVCKADCYLELGNYKTARQIYKSILAVDSNNVYVKKKLVELNDRTINSLKDNINKNPNNQKLRYKLSRWFLENSRFEDALEVAQGIEYEGEKIEEYSKLLGKIYRKMGKDKEALDIYIRWLNKKIEILKGITIGKKEAKVLGYIYSNIADIFVDLEKYEEAVGAYSKVIGLVGENHIILNSYAQALFKINNFEEAINIAKRSVILKNDQKDAYIILAKSYLNTEIYEKALENCKLISNMYPNLEEVYSIELIIYKKLNNYDLMLTTIKNMKKLKNLDDQTMLYELEALVITERDDEAELVGNEVLYRIKKNKVKDQYIVAEAYYLLATINNKNRINIDALKYIERAVKINPESAKYNSLRIKLLIEDKSFTEALEICNEIANKDPNNNEIYGLISILYEELNDEELAIEYLNKQIDINPNQNYLNRRGLINYNRKNIDDAAIDFEYAIEIEPDSKYAYNNLGKLYLENYYYKKSIDCFIKSIELNNEKEYTMPYISLVEVYIKLERYENALKYCEIGIEKTTAEIIFLEHKAKILMKLDRYSEAVECYEAINRIDNTIEEVYTSLVKLYSIIKEYSKAIAMIDKLRNLLDDNSESINIAKKIHLEIEDKVLSNEFNENVVKKIKRSSKKLMSMWL